MRLLMLSGIQSLMLCLGQVTLKFAILRMGKFAFSMDFFVRNLTNWWFLGCGICYAVATILWMYILKHFPFSMAYPMISLSYVFGMLAAIYVFHEQVPPVRWLGVLLIMSGCVLIAK